MWSNPNVRFQGLSGREKWQWLSSPIDPKGTSDPPDLHLLTPELIHAYECIRVLEFKFIPQGKGG